MGDELNPPAWVGIGVGVEGWGRGGGWGWGLEGVVGIRWGMDTPPLVRFRPSPTPTGWLRLWLWLLEGDHSEFLDGTQP